MVPQSTTYFEHILPLCVIQENITHHLIYNLKQFMNEKNPLTDENIKLISWNITKTTSIF